MATVLTARLYFDSSRPAPAVLAGLVEAVDAWIPKLEGSSVAESHTALEPGRWQGLNVMSTRGHPPVFQDKALLASGPLVATAARFDAPSLEVSTVAAFPCWRFYGQGAEAGSSVAWVEAWGDEYGRVFGEDLAVWGSAAFTISTCGPYCAVIDRSGPQVDERNLRVEDNLEWLTELLVDIVARLQPKSLKVYTEMGVYLPFNAHFAAYASEEALIDDLRLIATVWERGLPGYHVPPLGQPGDPSASAFHLWRNRERRQRLRDALGERIRHASAIEPHHVKRLLASGRFDNLTLPRGFALLEYPHFVNAFIDRFFVELLDER